MTKNPEQWIRDIPAGANSSPEADRFLDTLHYRRQRRAQQRQRLTTGFAALMLIVALGIGLFDRLDPRAPLIQYDYLVASQYGITPEEEQQFISDAALYLLEESDDLYSTLAFFENIDYKPITTVWEEN